MTTARTDDRPGLPARLHVKIIMILNGTEFVLPAYPPPDRLDRWPRAVVHLPRPAPHMAAAHAEAAAGRLAVLARAAVGS